MYTYLPRWISTREGKDHLDRSVGLFTSPEKLTSGQHSYKKARIEMSGSSGSRGIMVSKYLCW